MGQWSLHVVHHVSCARRLVTRSYDLVMNGSCMYLVTTLWVVCFLVAQMVKNLPALWETQVKSLDWEDSLEKGMTTHSSILAWRIPWTEEPGRLQSMGSQRVGHYWMTFTLWDIW